MLKIVFFKIAAKNLAKVKSRTILTVLAIALGTALLTGITILNESYENSYIQGVSNQLGFTDLGFKRHLNTSDGFFESGDFIEATGLEDIDGVLDHTGRIVEKHIATDSPTEISEQDAYETTFFGIDIEGDVGYGYAEILEWSEAVDEELDSDPETIEEILTLNKKYVVITSWVKEVYEFEVGEQIVIPLKKYNTTDLDNSSTWEPYTVAAVINDFAEGWDVNFDYSKNDTSSIRYSRAMYFDIGETRKMLNISDNYINLLYVHVELNKIQEVGQEILNNIPNDFFGHNIKSGELERVYDSLRSIQMILVIFTMISFIVAAMLTTNTLMMSVNEQKYEVGVLRAQGIYKGEIFKMFFFEAFLLAFMGTISGVLMGLGMSPLLKRAFFTTIMSDSSFQLYLTFKPLSILGVFLLTFIISLLIGMIPAYLGTKTEIIEAIRNIKSSKRGKKIRKLIFPLTGILLLLIGYFILATSYRDLAATLIGIIPFILGLIVLSTVLIPLLSKGFSYLFAFFLGAYRNVTSQNLKRDPGQTKITFIMFGLAIGFLVMISNVLHSIEIVQNEAVPRYLGADVVLYSEGSTFGMDEVLIGDEDIIDGAVEKATVLNQFRVKVDDYGVWPHDKQDEPRVNMYIIEGEKFYDTVNEIVMLDTGGLSDEEVFKKLDDPNSNYTIVCKQLLDKNHLNKGVGDTVEIDTGGLTIESEIIGIADFITGVSETWEEPQDILPADRRGNYALCIGWNSIIPFIDNYFGWLPECDILLKGNDDDYDYWDLPLINRTLTKQKILDYAQNNGYEGKVTLAERIWDENKSAIIADSSYNLTQANPIGGNGKYIHVAFENTSLEGYTELLDKKKSSYETVQDALNDGPDHCVITKDIKDDLGIKVNDQVSFWYGNSTNDPVRKNFTVAAVLSFETTVEAINFHAKNPYISGNYDVAADDTSAIIININQTAPYGSKLMYEDYFNTTDVMEFWIQLVDYFDNHLQFIAGLQKYMGDDYVLADMRWLFTKEFSYAPAWLIQVSDGFTQEEALERVKEYLLDNKMPAISWNTVDDLREQYADQIEFQKGFFNIVLSFALIIAVLGIMINMLISISNRKREIGMMRAIGTYKKDLMKMILGETLILVFSGFLIGAIMGSLAANQMLLGLPLDAVFDLRLIIDYLSIISLFGIVIAVSIIAAALPIYTVLKLDVIEAMRTG